MTSATESTLRATVMVQPMYLSSGPLGKVAQQPAIATKQHDEHQDDGQQQTVEDLGEEHHLDQRQPRYEDQQGGKADEER